MDNTMLLSAAVSGLPLLAIVFVFALLLHKFYFRIRSRFDVTVNCWFCNQNTKVPYAQSNSWMCPHCEQYNGFTKDGDYNRQILQQWDCSSSHQSANDALNEMVDEFTRPPPQNGLCNVCNEAQRLKVEKLAQFEPKNESHFEQELKVYKTQLEDQYRLCTTCDGHLHKVLREKKKMVLGSKFLDFIIKGAETIKQEQQQSHFLQLRHTQRLQWKFRLNTMMKLLTVVNIGCLIGAFVPVTLKPDQCTQYLGKYIGNLVFIVLSHILAFFHVLYSYLMETLSASQYTVMEKLALFLRTIFMMLIYSLGLKSPDLNFVPMYLLAAPYGILVMALVYNVIDGFRLTRISLLLVVWSILAPSFMASAWLYIGLSQNVLLLLASLLTIALLLTRREVNSPKLHDTSASSFHKILSEDYMSDEDTRDTISLLSQQLNESAGSVYSMNSSGVDDRRILSAQRSQQTSPIPMRRQYQAQGAPYSYNSPLSPAAPSTASLLSINTQAPFAASASQQLSPNSSFRSLRIADNGGGNQQHPLLRRSNCAASMGNFSTVPPSMMSPRGSTGASLFASNLELGGNRGRPMSSVGMGATAYGGAANSNSGLMDARMHPQYRRHDSHQYRNSDEQLPYAANTGVTASTMNNRPLHSPFSASSNAVFARRPEPMLYDGHRRTFAVNFMSPKHFSTNSLAGDLQSTDWRSGGYFNSNVQSPQRAYYDQQQYQQQQQQQRQHQGMTAIDENLSRASSQSSGFESQTDRFVGALNGGGNKESRENSSGPLTETLDAEMAELNRGQNSETTSSFRPVGASDTWNIAPPARKGLHDVGSFNLSGINDELPNIQRGDLLKRWKESQNQAQSAASAS